MAWSEKARLAAALARGKWKGPGIVKVMDAQRGDSRVVTRDELAYKMKRLRSEMRTGNYTVLSSDQVNLLP